MIKIENAEIVGWEHAVRGMRNPRNSWSKSDSGTECAMDKFGDCLNNDYINCDHCTGFKIGPNDHGLMMKLVNGGPVHAKYRRMIVVYLDVTAPLYWWKEFDTYKVGTAVNSCSSLYEWKLRPFKASDFSCEHLTGRFESNGGACDPEDVMDDIIMALNTCRGAYIETKDKKYWWQIIHLLPASYNQKRTVMLNYEVLSNIYKSRKNHKLDEWNVFCDWIEELPYSELITGETGNG